MKAGQSRVNPMADPAYAGGPALLGGPAFYKGNFCFSVLKFPQKNTGPWLLGAPVLYIKEMFLFLF